MPYKSEKQRRFFHTEAAVRAGITPDMVREWDAASKGKHLPKLGPAEKKRKKHDKEK